MQKFNATTMEVTTPLTVERMGVSFDVKISEVKGVVIVSLMRGDKEAYYYSVRKGSTNPSKGADFYKLSKHEQKQAENITISISVVVATETPLTEEQKERRELESYARKNLEISRERLEDMEIEELRAVVQHDL